MGLSNLNSLAVYRWHHVTSHACVVTQPPFEWRSILWPFAFFCMFPDRHFPRVRGLAGSDTQRGLRFDECSWSPFRCPRHQSLFFLLAVRVVAIKASTCPHWDSSCAPALFGGSDGF